MRFVLVSYSFLVEVNFIWSLESKDSSRGMKSMDFQKKIVVICVTQSSNGWSCFYEFVGESDLSEEKYFSARHSAIISQ